MNGYLKRMILLAAALLVCVGLTPSAQGASFDCGRAGSKVEKLICADDALSKLDGKMNAAYKIALKKYGQAEATRGEQAQWLKDRNSCESKSCLKALYQARLQELSIDPAQFKAMLPTVLVDTSDKPVFDNEADKLKFMRYIARQHEFESPKSPQNSVFCQQFFYDFIKGGQLEAVEPDVRANDANDPRLEKWHRCEDKEIASDGFDYLSVLGGPPYRYYQIDVDGYPDNGKEDVIYTDYKKTASGGMVGTNGYYWVDLESCTFNGAAHLSTGRALFPLHPNVYHLNSIVKYVNRYWAVEMSPLGRPGYSLHANTIGTSPDKQICYWSPKNK